MDVRHYGTFDTAGLPRAFYATDVYPDIVLYGPPPEAESGGPTMPAAQVELSRARNPAVPAEAVALTTAQWVEFIEHTGLRRWDAKSATVVSYDPPPPPPPPLPDISDAQFGQGLWRDGVISYAECMAFVQVGQLPATLDQLLAHLPDDDDPNSTTPRKVARADIAGRRMFQFAHPLVETLRELMEHADPVWTVDHLRARWAVWATL